MSRDRSLFNRLEDHHGSHVTFGDNSRGKIEGIGSLGNFVHTYIYGVYYINDLKHNLLSISQLCDKGYNVSFNEHECKAVDKNTNAEIFTGKGSGNIYIINVGEVRNDICLVALNKNEICSMA